MKMNLGELMDRTTSEFRNEHAFTTIEVKEMDSEKEKEFIKNYKLKRLEELSLLKKEVEGLKKRK